MLHTFSPLNAISSHPETPILNTSQLSSEQDVRIMLSKKRSLTVTDETDSSSRKRICEVYEKSYLCCCRIALSYRLKKKTNLEMGKRGWETPSFLEAVAKGLNLQYTGIKEPYTESQLSTIVGILASNSSSKGKEKETSTEAYWDDLANELGIYITICEVEFKNEGVKERLRKDVIPRVYNRERHLIKQENRIQEEDFTYRVTSFGNENKKKINIGLFQGIYVPLRTASTTVEDRVEIVHKRSLKRKREEQGGHEIDIPSKKNLLINTCRTKLNKLMKREGKELTKGSSSFSKIFDQGMIVLDRLAPATEALIPAPKDFKKLAEEYNVYLTVREVGAIDAEELRKKIQAIQAKTSDQLLVDLDFYQSEAFYGNKNHPKIEIGTYEGRYALITSKEPNPKRRNVSRTQFTNDRKNWIGEDTLLVNIIKNWKAAHPHQKIKWKKIVSKLNRQTEQTYTFNQCKTKYNSLMNGGKNDEPNKWTKEELQIIYNTTCEFRSITTGKISWKELSRKLNKELRRSSTPQQYADANKIFHPNIIYGPFSEEECELLIRGKAQQLPMSEIVSKLFHYTRTKTQLNEKWALLDPNLRKGYWTKEEDEILIQGYNNKRKVSEIAKIDLMGTRTAKQCRRRWHALNRKTEEQLFEEYA